MSLTIGEEVPPSQCNGCENEVAEEKDCISHTESRQQKAEHVAHVPEKKYKIISLLGKGAKKKEKIEM